MQPKDRMDRLVVAAVQDALQPGLHLVVTRQRAAIGPAAPAFQSVREFDEVAHARGRQLPAESMQDQPDVLMRRLQR